VAVARWDRRVHSAGSAGPAQAWRRGSLGAFGMAGCRHVQCVGCCRRGCYRGARTPASDWAAIGYLAVLVTAVAFVLWYSAVLALGAGRAGLLTGIAPVSAALSGVLVGADAPDALLWVGIGTVVFGLVLGRRPRAERAVTNAATASYPQACPLQPAGIRQTA
jgi:drug/metabolite transporter (DMT)-like permease